MLALARCLCGDPSSSCSTSRPKASSRRSSRRSSRPAAAAAPTRGLTMVLVEQNLDFIAALSRPRPDHPEGPHHRRDPARSPARRRAGRGIRRHERALTVLGHHEGESTMASVKMPTPAELKQVGSELGMNLSDADVALLPARRWPAMSPPTICWKSLPDNLPRGEVSAHAGLPARGRGEQVQRLVLKSEIKGAPDGKLAGKKVALKDNVCLAGVPMMNGASHARRLRARRRRHGRHPHARCRRHHRRQGPLRVFLLLRRQPHLRARPGPQSAQVRLLGRRLVLGQRRHRRHRRGRHGDRRRPGRLDPHARGLLRHRTA